ncbi:hypothetical protein EBR96_07245, partial [bacterium]|nr:hypothetical protein [bacterium]
LNAQILAARQQLTALRQLRQAENTPQPSRQSAGSNSSSVIIIDDRYSTPVYSRPIPYWRGFRHEDYTPPPIIINTPPTAEERAKYIEEKRERIQEIRSRTKR